MFANVQILFKTHEHFHFVPMFQK